ncbi:MAG: PadR family transcriptional regulator [Odoribacteraceae bacterium]|jgi:PadR family transcriptional regulator PadR|nr:PadR family transcriptional regulator [Odoribacteraceae bacterium]
MSMDNAKAQMRKGVLEYCTLSILARGDAYAPDIINRLKEARMIVVEGTLYPLLTRQKDAGWLAYRWEESQQGPPRKYYSITGEGRQFLADLDASWQELVETVNKLRHQNTPNTETL